MLVFTTRLLLASKVIPPLPQILLISCELLHADSTLISECLAQCLLLILIRLALNPGLFKVNITFA